MDELRAVTLAPPLATGDKPLDVTARVLERAGKTVLGGGKLPLAPFRVGPPVVANCVATGEGPKEAAAGTPTEVLLTLVALEPLVDVLLPEVVPTDVVVLPAVLLPLLELVLLAELLLVVPLAPLLFAVTDNGEGTDEVPPPLAHAAVPKTATIPAM